MAPQRCEQGRRGAAIVEALEGMWNNKGRNVRICNWWIVIMMGGACCVEWRDGDAVEMDEAICPQRMRHGKRGERTYFLQIAKLGQGPRPTVTVP